MKMTIIQAILEVMRSEARPMTVREIYECIVRLDLYNFRAVDPVHVVRSQIIRHCLGKNQVSYSDSKYFEMVGNKKYYFLPEVVYQKEIINQEEVHKKVVLEKKQFSRKKDKNVHLIEKEVSARETIISAVKTVMQRHGKPMTVQQVYDVIKRENLYSFRASQPVHVVRSQIRRHCFALDFPSASETKHFERHGKDKYYFLDHPIQQKSSINQIGTDTTAEEMAERQIQLEVVSTGKFNRDQVFISYSHKDLSWLQRLQVHLKPLERVGIITRWDDTNIKAGAKWRDEIEHALNRARVAILLISADFLASDFIIKNELPPLLQAAASQGAMILPVIISPCRFEKMESLVQFQAVNSPSKPLTGLNKTKREEIFVKVADAVEASLYPL